MFQVEFGKRLGVSQGTVSAWERDDKDRLPSADMYFRLATFASRPEDQVFFLQEAGLSGEIILSAAEKIFADRIAPPSEGEIFRVPIVRRTAKGNEETGEFLPVPAYLLSGRASAIALAVHEDFSRANRFKGHRMLPPGDIIVLDTSGAGTQKAAPFLDQIVVIDINWDHTRIGGRPYFGGSQERRNSAMYGRHVLHSDMPEGLFMGLLRCKRPLRNEYMKEWTHWELALSWSEHFEGEENEATESDLLLGQYFEAWDGENPTQEDVLAWHARMREHAFKEITFEPQCRLLGRVIAWLPSPATKPKKQP
jgi:transcriptional regulator with XRE-family HTH domain